MQIPFDMSSQEELKEFQPLPEGWYDFRVVACDDSSKDGRKTIRFAYEVVSNESKGERINQFCTWDSVKATGPNSDEGLIRRGRQTIKSLAVACGVPNTQDTQDLMYKTFAAYVVVDKPNPTTGRVYNSIQKFEKRRTTYETPPNVDASTAFWENQ